MVQGRTRSRVLTQGNRHGVQEDSREEQEQSHRRGSSREKKKLGKQGVLLLTVNGLFSAANALSGTFMGVYLWKAKNDFATIGWFMLVTHFTMALTFWLAGKWVKEHNKMIVLRLGIALFALFYLLLLYFGVNSVRHILLLGFVQGMASGFFWLSFNVVYFEITEPGNRDRFNGWTGTLVAVSGMAAPWLSGLIIASMTGNSGYRVVFTISTAIFIAGVVVSFFLAKRKLLGTYNWMLPLQCLRDKEAPWRSIAAALVAQGVREGVFGFLIALLVYIATTSEQKLGNYALITSGVSFFSNWLVGRTLKPVWRRQGMFVGVIMLILVILPFFWKVSFGTLLVFGVGTAVFMPLFSIPMTSAVFDLIGRYEESVKQREEFIVMRELALNVGRIGGTFLFITIVSWNHSPLVLNLLLLGIGSSPFFTWLYMRRYLDGISPAGHLLTE
ncbi:MFS transporter [Paenibacillus larvae]